MKKTSFSLLILFAITFTSVIGVSFIVLVSAEPAWEAPDYIPVDWKSGLAGEVFMPKLAAPDSSYSRIFSSGLMGDGNIGDQAYDWYLGAATGNPWMTLKAQREFVEIWVSDDLSYPEGDPRNDNPIDFIPSDTMYEYLADEFNDVIYDRVSGMFGRTADRWGNDTLFEFLGWEEYYYNWTETTEPQKVILKILNIRDDSFYDPDYPAYIVGFFSSTYNGYYDRNIIHIDCWKWWERLGPEGYSWYPGMEVTRPNLYESTTAHEYQHNIHGDQLPGDLSYMNEASSLFAEPICGYELDAGQIEWFLATPDNSLTQWGDQGDINILADYGASFLWALYLTDHFGIDFMGQYTQGGIVGIEGINALLDPFGTDFYEVFHDWRLANLLQMDSGPWGYELDELQVINPDAVLDFNELEPLKIHEIEARQSGWMTASKLFGQTYTTSTDSAPVGYKTHTFNVGAFGTEYIMFSNLKEGNEFLINGEDDIIIPGWTYDSGYWYSGADDLLNTLIATEVFIDPLDPTLTLITYWDIEDYWDFGFVQVSTDGNWDSEWISLENANTTYLHDPAAHINVLNNLPGLTGWSVDIVEITFDMSAYAGLNVHLGFRYVTDWSFTYAGWYLFSAIVSGVEVLGNLDYVYPEVDFMVTIVENYGTDNPIVHDMVLDDATEFGVIFMYVNKHEEDIVVVISPMMELGAADYKFKIEKIFDGVL